MVREAVTQVKAYDPEIELLNDDDMWVIHCWFLEKKLPSQLDGIAFHPYVNNVPEIAAVDQDTEWAKPFTLVDADGSFRSAVRRLREESRLKIGTEPSMWITEWGWPVGGQRPMERPPRKRSPRFCRVRTWRRGLRREGPLLV